MAHYIPDYDLLFIHIPKTGGTSIFTWIEDNFNFIQQGSKHTTIKHYEKSFIKPANYFSVVRHPVDRLLSWYHYQYKMVLYRKDKGKPKLNDEEITELYKSGFNQSFTGNTNVLFDKTILCPQSKFFADDITFLIKYESLNNDFKILQNFTNCVNPLPFKNSSNNKKTTTSIDKKTLDNIFDIYKKDFKNLGYNI